MSTRRPRQWTAARPRRRSRWAWPRAAAGGRACSRSAPEMGPFVSLMIAGPSGVLVVTQDTLSLSRDAGETFALIPHTGISAFYRVKVSPTDPRRLLCQNPQDNGGRCYSRDGGMTRAKSGKNVDWGLGHRAGRHYHPGRKRGRNVSRGQQRQHRDHDRQLVQFQRPEPGYTVLRLPGLQRCPDGQSGQDMAVYQPIQRQQELKPRRRWDPWVYGGYAASPLILYGGKTTMQKAGNLAGAQVSLGAPTDPNLLFCWTQRSMDRGRAGAAMAGCDGVFAAGPTGGRALYGRSGKAVVRSRDKGPDLGAADSESRLLRRGRLRGREGEHPARPPRHPRAVRRHRLLRDLEDRPARGREGVGGEVMGAPKAPSVGAARLPLPREPAAPASARPLDPRRSASGNTGSAPGRPAS